MKITNRLNLPRPIIRALEADPYDGPGPHGREISVSQLIGPPQIRSLMAEHESEVEQDASDMLHALLGTAFHAVLARGAHPSEVIERRFAVHVNGWTVSGQVDRYLPDKGLLQDWKTCSAWKVMLGGNSDWEAQLNCYAWILRKLGRKVERLEVVAFLKDLAEVRKTAKRRNLPESDVVVLAIPLWEQEKAETFVRERVAAHEAALTGKPAPCSPVETWGGKRCEKYCPVRHFCPQIAPDPMFEVS